VVGSGPAPKEKGKKRRNLGKEGVRKGGKRARGKLAEKSGRTRATVGEVEGMKMRRICQKRRTMMKDEWNIGRIEKCLR